MNDNSALQIRLRPRFAIAGLLGAILFLNFAVLADGDEEACGSRIRKFMNEGLKTRNLERQRRAAGKVLVGARDLLKTYGDEVSDFYPEKSIRAFPAIKMEEGGKKKLSIFSRAVRRRFSGNVLFDPYFLLQERAHSYGSLNSLGISLEAVLKDRPTLNEGHEIVHLEDEKSILDERPGLFQGYFNRNPERKNRLPIGEYDSSLSISEARATTYLIRASNYRGDYTRPHTRRILRLIEYVQKNSRLLREGIPSHETSCLVRKSEYGRSNLGRPIFNILIYRPDVDPFYLPAISQLGDLFFDREEMILPNQIDWQKVENLCLNRLQLIERVFENLFIRYQEIKDLLDQGYENEFRLKIDSLWNYLRSFCHLTDALSPS